MSFLFIEHRVGYALISNIYFHIYVYLRLFSDGKKKHFDIIELNSNILHEKSNREGRMDFTKGLKLKSSQENTC